MTNIEGIYRDNPMADKLMYITTDDTLKYPFFRLKLVFEYST